MLDSNGTVSSRMMILREGKVKTRSGRSLRGVHKTSGGMVEAPGRGQSGKSAKIVGAGVVEEEAEIKDW